MKTDIGYYDDNLCCVYDDDWCFASLNKIKLCVVYYDDRRFCAL